MWAAHQLDVSFRDEPAPLGRAHERLVGGHWGREEGTSQTPAVVVCDETHCDSPALNKTSVYVNITSNFARDDDIV